MAAVAGAIAAGTVVVGAHVIPAGTWLPGVRLALFPTLAGRGMPGHIALTFDDGPDPASTPRFLDTLDELDVRGTFFLVGDSARRHRRLATEIADRGHELAVHGWTHDQPWLPSVRGELRDLRRAAAVVGELSGVDPRWYRPPYGILTGGRGIAAALAGLQPVLWTAWGLEWKQSATAATVRERITRDLRGGGTVLLHDTDRSGGGSWRPALEALPGLVAGCRAAGWALGPLREHW
jgi:peptidoglycan/xylan/chitin deacetylase (PgdA/CDA1 family)